MIPGSKPPKKFCRNILDRMQVDPLNGFGKPQYIVSYDGVEFGCIYPTWVCYPEIFML